MFIWTIESVFNVCNLTLSKDQWPSSLRVWVKGEILHSTLQLYSSLVNNQPVRLPSVDFWTKQSNGGKGNCNTNMANIVNHSSILQCLTHFLIEGLLQKTDRLRNPRKLLQQKTLMNSKWTGTMSVIHQSNVSSLRKIRTVSWTSRINLNTWKRARTTKGNQNTGRRSPVTGGLVSVGEIKVPVTEGITEDRITGVMDAGRSTKSTEDRAEGSRFHRAQHEHFSVGNCTFQGYN